MTSSRQFGAAAVPVEFPLFHNSILLRASSPEIHFALEFLCRESDLPKIFQSLDHCSLGMRPRQGACAKLVDTTELPVHQALDVHFVPAVNWLFEQEERA